MKRLTQRIKNTGAVITPYCLLEETCDGMGASQKCENCEHEKWVLEKLASYEDAEEQGLLLRLPCKVGDIVEKYKPNHRPTNADLIKEMGNETLANFLKQFANDCGSYCSGVDCRNCEKGILQWLQEEPNKES